MILSSAAFIFCAKAQKATCHSTAPYSYGIHSDGEVKRIEGSHTVIRSAGDVIGWHCMEVDNNLKHLNQARLFDAWADKSEGEVTE